MRIQHNITAMNSYRNYASNTKAVSKNLEKLSSGYKINRAGDDAAGLAISEKMRAQITGLETAQKNAKDGISLVQTAEGSLTEVHSMLNRMYELGEQSANGTYDNSVDRANLQKEVSALKTEIDRIADSSNFNGIKLLDGSLESSSAATGNGAVVSGAGQLTTTAAVKGVYNTTVTLGTADTADLFAATTNVTGHAIKLSLAADDGSTYELKFAIAGGPGAVTVADAKTAISAALAAPSPEFQSLNPDWDKISSKFDITTTATDGKIGFTFTAKEAGTTSPAITSSTMTAHIFDSATGDYVSTISAAFNGGAAITGATSTTTTAKDSYAQINFGSITNANLENKSLTVGGKTYTFAKAEDLYKLDKGVVGITMGDTRADTMKNLAAALQANGVTSAVADGQNIKVSDATQVASAYTVSATNATATAANQITVGTAAENAYGTHKAGQTIAIGDNSGNADAGSTVTVNGKTYEFVSDLANVKEGNTGVMIGADDKASAANLRAALKADGIESKQGTVDDHIVILESDTQAASKGGLTLQIGDTSEDFNKLTVSVGDMHSTALGIKDVDISTQTGAADAIAKIKTAINTVSSTRGDLGALQNRLDHTINNLSVMQENIQDAESTIRDVDVAKEMMAYTKNNILVQSAQAMLAQANQLPQGVLQLLQ